MCNDDLHDGLCLAQDEQTPKREHASTHALKHPLLEFSLTNGFAKLTFSFPCELFSHFHLETFQEERIRIILNFTEAKMMFQSLNDLKYPHLHLNSKIEFSNLHFTLEFQKKC